MTDKKQLIETWTRNLEDNAEHQLHAIGLLTEEIDDNAPSIPVVSAMLQKVTPQSRKTRRWVMLSLTTLAVLLCLPQLFLPVQMRIVLQKLNLYGSSLTFSPKIRTNTPDEQLLLYGDPNRVGQASQMRALWESDPKNPAYFADYSLRYIGEYRDVPSDYLKTAAEIDPDNAWFPTVVAGIKAKDTYKKSKTAHPLSPVNEATVRKAPSESRRLLSRQIVKESTIIDPVGAKEALDLWRQSLKHGKFESYEISMHQQRYPMLRNRQSYLDQFPPLIYMMDHSTAVIQSRDLCMLLATTLQNADLQSEEGKQLIRDIDTYMDRLLHAEPATMIDVLILRANLTEMYKQINVIDTSALDPLLVEKWKKRHVALDEYDKLIQENRENDSNGDFISRHGSMLSALTMPILQTMRPMPLTEEDLAPLRYTDHAMFLRLVAALMCGVLLMMIPYHLWSRRAKLIHKVSDEAWQTMRWGPLSFLVLLSVGVPLLYFAVITVFTPLTGKAYGTGYALVVPFYPVISVVLLLLLLPRLLVHRCTAPWEQLAPTRSRWHRRLGWIACGLALLPMHSMSFFMESPLSHAALNAFVLTCWVPSLLWLLWNGGKGFFARNFYSSAMHGLRRRVVGVCTVMAIPILTLTGWALQRCESYWIQRDKVMEIAPDRIATGKYEAEVINAMHEDLRMMIEK